MDKRWDLIIIGGGPAGTSLSILMARAGYEVLLLEKGHYPMQKVCGEYLSREALPYLKELGIPYESFDPPPIDHLRVSSSKGASLECELPLGGIGLSRYELDRSLAVQSHEEGVHVEEGSRVRSVTPERSGFLVETREAFYHAHQVVEAFGKDKAPQIRNGGVSHTKKKRGGKRWVGIKHRVEGGLPDKRIELHSFPGGYAGLSKIEGEGKGCMSYLIEASHLKGIGQKRAEEELLSSNPLLAERLSSLGFPENPTGISNLSFGDKALADEGGWYSGDAAASIPPFAGNGMSMAIESSFLLAPRLKAVLAKKVSKKEAAKRYEEERKQIFKTRMRVGAILQDFFAKDGQMNILIRCMKPFPALTKGLIRMTHGSQPRSTGF